MNRPVRPLMACSCGFWLQLEEGLEFPWNMTDFGIILFDMRDFGIILFCSARYR
jgi:hypothetical protein